MKQEDLEMVYENLAMALDALPEDQRPLYLAKLTLLLANELGDAERANTLIKDATQNLERAL